MERILNDKKTRESLKEISKISNLIREAENKKCTQLINLGILAYDKIRRGYLYDRDFDNICNEIKELDIFIYNNNLEIEKINEMNTGIKCNCGSTLNKQDKFCSECGINIEELNKKETISCDYCNSQIDIDSNFCVCCGNRII